MLTISETKASQEKFKISPGKRMKAYKLLISNMSEPAVFKLVQDIFVRIVNKFISNEMTMDSHSILLSDAFNSLHMMENKLHSITKTEANIDDVETERTIDASKAAIKALHNTMISTMLPSLKKIHKIVRENNSPIQNLVRGFYQQLCKNDPELLQELERSEPILAAEIAAELIISADEEIEKEEVVVKNIPLASPLLIRIHNTPISLLCSP